MFEYKKTHSGQYRRYGDSFYKWDIETDLPKEEVLKKCFEELADKWDHDLPEQNEWKLNVRSGGSHEYDYGYYFAGYYSLHKTNGGYEFTICKPYTG